MACYILEVSPSSKRLSVNPRRARGGCLDTPLRFFAGAAIFDTAVHTSFPHTLWKFRTQVTHGQVTRSRQVASPQKNIWMFVIATPNNRSPWNFQVLIFVLVSMKHISRNFDIGDLRSGQFCGLSIISQWEKNKKRLFWTKTIISTLKH